MKLIQLEMLNLASLDKQGGEVINFMKGALGDSNIFCIVGPTGSGKSTILDAICLALYNRAPRYPKKKNEKRQSIEIYGQPDDKEANRLPPTDCRNILTRGKKEGYSKLTFQANNGNVYRAEWHVRFKTKKYENAITSLYRIFTDNKGIPQEETAEWEDLPNIIGLDYDQFLRTVLIAQGSFANFLTAKENERYELLEKLIGCEEMYSRIASEIKTKRDEAVEAFNIVNASVETVRQNLLSDEEKGRLEEEIGQLEKMEKELEKARKTVETQLQWYADDEKLSQDIERLQMASDKARQSLDDYRPVVLRLNLHDDISPAVECLRDVRKMETNMESIRKTIQDYEAKSKQQDGLILAANDLCTQLKEVAEKAQTAIDTTTPHIQNARVLLTKIEAATNTCKDKLKAKDAAKKDWRDAKTAVKNNEADTEKAKGLADKATKDLQDVQVEIGRKKEELRYATEKAEEALKEEKRKVEGMDADDLQNLKTQAHTDWQNLKRAVEVVELTDKAMGEKKEKSDRKTELEARNALLSGELGKLCIESLKKEIETLRKTYTLMTSEKWNQHRAALEEGVPCPLCGATEHPYKVDETGFEDVTSDLFNILQDKERTLAKQQKDEMEWSGEKKKNEGVISGLEQRLQQLETDIDKFEDEWKSLLEWNPQMKKDKVMLGETLPSFKKLMEDADANLTFFNKVQTAIGKLTKKKDDAVKKQAKYAEDAAELLAKAQENAISANNKLTEAKALRPTLLQQLEDKRNALDLVSKEWGQADDFLKQLQADYKKELGEETPDVVERRLKKRKNDADEAVTKKNEEISRMKTALGQINGALQNQKDLLEKEELSLAGKNKELKDWIALYNDKEDKIKMVSMDDVVAMYLATDDWNAIRQEKERRNEKVVSSSALLKNAKDNRERHKTSKPEKDRDELQGTLKELQENSHNDELVAAKARMKNHTDAIELLGDKVTELNRATKLKDDWMAITDAIGGDGKTLRKIAQCYTLGFLIEHANVEIRRFNSRYELVQVKNSLGIRVIDHDRADDVRDTTSLSGGETFIVSLGLALGLSSLSSRNLSFENLFIDEGFGTLDPDMLATVIDSLAMLQSSQGKKVGVISHTNTMSERITTQIRIIKNGNSGSSHIEIYP